MAETLPLSRLQFRLQPHPALSELDACLYLALFACRHLAVEIIPLSSLSDVEGVEMLLVYCVVLLAVLAANVTAILLAATIARRWMHQD